MPSNLNRKFVFWLLLLVPRPCGSLHFGSLQETEQIDRERQAREQDTICFLHLGPISEMMNSTNVQPDDACVEELTNDLDLVEDSRDECPGEFDLIYSNTRNSLHSNPDVTRCPALFENLKNRVNAVLLDKAVDLSIDENPTAEEQGETDTCRNLVFNEDRDPWEDSDGDTCAVYKRYVCRDPRYPTPIHTIQTDCESGDCKGTGGYYATDACCACGGGAQVGHQHKFGREENRDMINQNRCMLASCLMKVGDCQTHEGCIRGLGRVAKAYQHFHHHHNSTGWCEIQELTIEQCLQYHTSGLSAEAKSSLLLVAECASTQEQECEPSLSPSTSSPITSAPTPLPTENPTLAPTSPSSAPTTVSPTVAEEASTVTDDTKGAHNGNDGGTKKQPVGLIVGLSLLGGVVAICGLAGGYVLYKRKVRREFRRVLASDEEDALRGMRSLPAGGLQVLEPEL
mmetsp:Transcript_21666/g.42097  ORF Transcript_21666/g.42097 Transcript_21666/m.42097 type:complete len:456 (-) Transcript_21666:181-1548(-)